MLNLQSIGGPRRGNVRVSAESAIQGESNFGDSSGLFLIYCKAADDEDIRMVDAGKTMRWDPYFTGLFSAAVAALLSVTVQDLGQTVRILLHSILGTSMRFSPTQMQHAHPFPLSLNHPRSLLQDMHLGELTLVLKLRHQPDMCSVGNIATTMVTSIHQGRSTSMVQSRETCANACIICGGREKMYILGQLKDCQRCDADCSSQERYLRVLAHLKDRYHRWMLGGVEKAAEEMVSEDGTVIKIDIRIFDWTIGVLGDDESLEKFFEAIPGFFSSKLVNHFESDFPKDTLKKFWSALNGFMNRTLSSNSVVESVKTRRVTICRDIMSTIPYPFISFERLQATESISDALRDDGPWEKLFEAVPRFFGSEQWIHGPHFSSSSVTDSLRGGRLVICLGASHAASGFDGVSQILWYILSGRWPELLQSVEVGHSLHRWGNSNDERFTPDPLSYRLCNVASHVATSLTVPHLTQLEQSPIASPPHPSPLEGGHTSDGSIASQQAEEANVIAESPSSTDYTPDPSHSHEFTSPPLTTNSVYITQTTLIPDHSVPEGIGTAITSDPDLLVPDEASALLATEIATTGSVWFDERTRQRHTSESGESSLVPATPSPIFQHPDLVAATIAPFTGPDQPFVPDPCDDLDAVRQHTTSSAILSYPLEGNKRQDTVTPCARPNINEIPSTINSIPWSITTATPIIVISDTQWSPPALSSGMTAAESPSPAEFAQIQIPHTIRSPSSSVTSASSYILPQVTSGIGTPNPHDDIHDLNPPVPTTLLPHLNQLALPAPCHVRTRHLDML
ncbi:hypothetical protein BJV77DRAFT_965443 [Russula vinacea]|nr:hypothetical protein BJV77DRAFT_965443 [Russula vinacea]